MKIAHVISTFPPRHGGMGQVCFEEAKRLAERGHDVTVFTLAYDRLQTTDYGLQFSDLGPALSADRLRTANCELKIVRLKPLFMFGDAGFAPQLFFKLKNFDLVHLHYPFYGAAQCVWLAKFFRGQKYVVTYHMDAHPVGFLKKLFQGIYDFVWAKKVLSGAEKVAVVDEDFFNASRHGRFVKKEKAVFLPNGVDLEIFKPRPKDLSAVGLPELAGKKIILFVGNLLPLKRLDLAIEALKILSGLQTTDYGSGIGGGHSLALVVVGGGYAEEKFKKMAVGANVVFAGSCPGVQKLAAYYNAADCLVAPSDFESFSLAALYGLASGLPIIASDIPGLRRRVADGQDGFLFKAGSAESLALALKKLFALTDEERKKMGEAGRAKAAAYSWNVHIEKLLEVYSGV